MFRVEWLQSALTQLSEIWLGADPPLRTRITQATHEIDRNLQTKATDFGESRSERSRIAFVAPLGFLFRVEPEKRLAVVERVWLLRQRS